MLMKMYVIEYYPKFQRNPVVLIVIFVSSMSLLAFRMNMLIAVGFAYGGFFGTFALVPDGTYKWYQVGSAEILYTFMLSFVALSVVTDKCPQYFDLVIGFVLVAVVIDVSHVFLGVELCFPVWALAYFAFELKNAGLAAVVTQQLRKGTDFFMSLSAFMLVLRPRYGSEFLGASMSVLTVGPQGDKGMVLSVATFSMGMTFVLGSVSCRHFNSAAICLAATGRPEVLMPSDRRKYSDAQLVGGIVDGLVAKLTGAKGGSVGPVAPNDWRDVKIVFAYEAREWLHRGHGRGHQRAHPQDVGVQRRAA